MEVVSIVIAIISITISSIMGIIVYRQTSKHHRDNIRIEKLEEVFSIIDYFDKIYPELLNLSLYLEPYYEDQEIDKKKVLKDYNEERSKKLKYISIEDLNNKFSRLYSTKSRIFKRV